jgi:8-oxo-dGTP diphosphatase
VLCSHGDVIPETIDALARRGCEIVGEPDWRKASVWQLGRESDGSIIEATASPPPAPR